MPRPRTQCAHVDRGRDGPCQRRSQSDMPAADAALARRKITAEIEKESLDKTGLRSNVVTLYQGGQYQLYRFKKYTDVRLVFAPEQQAAFFGGDPDNFEYPRYDLDICFFRVYENDQPAKIEHFLTWSKNGCADGELTFVSGHPGRTDRLLTVAELEYLRDKQFPQLLQRLYRLEVLYTAFSARSDENARRAREDLFGVQNSRKARVGGEQGLMDPAIMARKVSQERQLRRGRRFRPEAPRRRRRLGQDRPGGRKAEGNCPRIEPARKRHGFQQPPVRHRPHIAAWGRRAGQAEWRATARIPRIQLGIAQVQAVFRRTDLRRF